MTEEKCKKCEEGIEHGIKINPDDNIYMEENVLYYCGPVKYSHNYENLFKALDKDLKEVIELLKEKDFARLMRHYAAYRTRIGEKIDEEGK